VQSTSEASHWSNILSSSSCAFSCLRQHGICLLKLAFVKAAAGQGDDGGFFRQMDQNNYIGFDCGVFIAIDGLEIRDKKRGRYRNGQG